MLGVGQVVGGRYRLDQHLGDGGSGAVWAATQLLTREAVALKFLRKPGADQSRRFLREGRIATSLRHPNIVAVRDLFELESASLVMVMDLVQGETLSARLRRGPLSNAETVHVGVQIARALTAAHALGVVHRDLKPGNVVLSGPSIEPHVQILDFGIAKVIPLDKGLEETTSSTETGALLGTPHYMAPEQIFGERDVDGSADVWSLGIVLYECIAGTKPFEGDNYGQIFKSVTTQTPAPLATLRPECSPSLIALVARMLDRERASRPLSHEIEAALVANDAAPAVEAPRPRRAVSAGVASVAVLVAALGAGSLVWNRRHVETARTPVAVVDVGAPKIEAATPAPIVAPSNDSVPVVEPRSEAQRDATGRTSPSGAIRPAASSVPAGIGAASTGGGRMPSANSNKLPGGVHGSSPYSH